MVPPSTRGGVIGAGGLGNVGVRTMADPSLRGGIGVAVVGGGVCRHVCRGGMHWVI